MNFLMCKKSKIHNYFQKFQVIGELAFKTSIEAFWNDKGGELTTKNLKSQIS
jgi:hypothetical protein